MNRIIPMILMAALVAGCGNDDDRIAFDGEYFRMKVKKVDKQRDVFTVQVRDVSKSLDGARQAARYAGNAYCVETYGSSDIEWTIGPDTPAEDLTIVDDTLTFQGVCPKR